MPLRKLSFGCCRERGVTGWVRRPGAGILSNDRYLPDHPLRKNLRRSPPEPMKGNDGCLSTETRAKRVAPRDSQVSA